MRKLNKHQKIILSASLAVILLLSLAIVWMFLQYQETKTQGPYDDTTVYRNGEKIESVRGKGHVPGDEYKKNSSLPKTTNADNSANGGTTNPTGVKSGDPVYNSPAGSGKNSYSHNIDYSCFDASHDQVQRQQVAELDRADADAKNQVASLLVRIDQSKNNRPPDPQYQGEYSYLNNSYKNQAEARQRIPRPTADSEPALVQAYANAWSDNNYRFNEQASAIYKTRDDKKIAIAKSYGSCS